MSAVRADDSRVEGAAYIRHDLSDGGGMDREAMLHRRRKTSMISLLSEFEHEIERHIRPGHDREIAHFKRSCRTRLNGLTFLACELMKLQPGEGVNQCATDLAEQLAFDANGGHDT